MFSRTVLAVAVSSLAAFSTSAFAVSVNTAGGIVNGVAQFDWSPHNVLALNGQQAVENFIAAKTAVTNSIFAGTGPITPAEAIGILASGGTLDQFVNCGAACEFTAYAQGKLGNFNDAANNPIASTLGTNFEVTFTLGYTERVTAVVGNTATFSFGNSLGDTPVNFFKIYYDTTVDSSDLAGTGFDDGALVFEGDVTPKNGVYSSSFTVTDTSGTDALDDFLGDDWAGTTTVEGVGATSVLDLIVEPFATNQDFNFFLNEITKFEIANISASLAFNSVDPSRTFPVAGVPDTAAEIGAVNGDDDRGGNSVLFQSDSNSPIAGIPEPGSIALLSAAALAAGVMRKRSQA